MPFSISEGHFRYKNVPKMFLNLRGSLFYPIVTPNLRLISDSSHIHRIKDEKTKGRINWVHSLLKCSETLPKEWELTQCLFGEHLLAASPDKTVALVESEKTAVICSALMPEYIWLATGGKSQLNDRLRVLRGREVVAFPDVDGYGSWCDKIKQFPDLNITISPLLELNATPEDISNHIDIADWLIKWKQGIVQSR